MQKYTKQSVKYTDNHGKSSEQCSKCKYYVNRSTCRIVEGRIRPEGWCNRFERSVGDMEKRLEGKAV